MSIATITQHLVDQIKTITTFTGRVGVRVGGGSYDPINRDLPRPAAWVVYTGDTIVDGNELNPCPQVIKLNYSVMILVDYDVDLILTHLPLIHEVVSVVNGSEAIPGSKWFYEGQTLDELEGGRMVWQQNYSVRTSV